MPSRRMSLRLVALALLAMPSLAAIVISPAVNSGSLMPPGFPHYGIARGALFVVYGVDMGPAQHRARTVAASRRGTGGHVRASDRGRPRLSIA